MTNERAATQVHPTHIDVKLAIDPSATPDEAARQVVESVRRQFRVHADGAALLLAEEERAMRKARRERIATAAMQALIGRYDRRRRRRRRRHGFAPVDIGRDARMYADALIAALDNPKPARHIEPAPLTGTPGQMGQPKDAR